MLSDEVTDADGGNFPLDGDWTNPTYFNKTNYDTSGPSQTSSTFPSGDGVAGGDFELVFTYMADWNGDNFISQADLDPVLLNWGDTGLIATFITGDYDGSGQVGQGDLDVVLLYWGDDFKLLAIRGDLDGNFRIDDADKNEFEDLYGDGLIGADIDKNGIVNQADPDAFYVLYNFGIWLSVVT